MTRLNFALYSSVAYFLFSFALLWIAEIIKVVRSGEVKTTVEIIMLMMISAFFLFVDSVVRTAAVFLLSLVQPRVLANTFTSKSLLIAASVAGIFSAILILSFSGLYRNDPWGAPAKYQAVESFLERNGLLSGVYLALFVGFVSALLIWVIAVVKYFRA